MGSGEEEEEVEEGGDHEGEDTQEEEEGLTKKTQATDGETAKAKAKSRTKSTSYNSKHSGILMVSFFSKNECLQTTVPLTILF